MSNFAAHSSVKVLKNGPFKNQVGTVVGDNEAIPGEVLVRLEKDAKNDQLAKQVTKSYAEAELEAM